MSPFRINETHPVGHSAQSSNRIALELHQI